MTLGERIKTRRLELGWTQAELAERLGNKSRASVCTVETGKEDLTTDRIVKYAEALGCTPGDLMGWTTNEFNMKEWIKKESYALESSGIFIERLNRDEMDLVNGFRAAVDSRKEDMLDMARKAIAQKEGNA